MFKYAQWIKFSYFNAYYRKNRFKRKNYEKYGKKWEMGKCCKKKNQKKQKKNSHKKLRIKNLGKIKKKSKVNFSTEKFQI